MINIILYQPEKPQNTGNIMRTCSAFDMKLFIIGPLTYTINDESLKRAGMDYLLDVDYKIYKDYEEFLKDFNNKEIFYITRYGTKTPDKFNFKNLKEVNLMFGKESTGIPIEILKSHINHCIRVPMKVNARSLNLSNTVAILSYEALRQLNYLDLSTEDFLKGNDYLSK